MIYPGCETEFVFTEVADGYDGSLCGVCEEKLASPGVNGNRIEGLVIEMIENELIIDNFAGGGGASVGMEMALGRSIDIAINHDLEAVTMHRANHPHTLHYCEDVWAVDPVAACNGRPVGLAWFSPDCKHFSKAKGGQPVSRKVRGLAWVVIRWARKVRPRVIMLENVEEFQDWGPLVPACDKSGRPKIDATGKVVMLPCGINRGQTFFLWVRRLENLGYRVEWKKLKACDYGAPTIRKRLFLVARRDGQQIVWPEPTHGDPKCAGVQSGKLLPWRTAAECIDWSIPAPSIFERKRRLAEATLRRIAKGVMRYVVNNPDPFIVTYYGSKGPDFRGQDINNPLATQTTENRHALIEAFLAKHYGGVVGSDLQDPLGTVTSIDHHSLVSANLIRHFGKSSGVAIDDPACTITGKSKDSLVTAHFIRQFGQSVGSDSSVPVGTITPGGLGKTGLVTSHLVKLRGTCRDGQEVMAPVPTITASGTHIGEVRAFLLKYYGSDQDPRLNEPLHTITTRDRFGLVTVKGEQYTIVDIGMRMLSPRELFRAQGFPDTYIIDPAFNGKNMTKTAQVRMCGNSVSPWPAAALVGANFNSSASAAVA